MGQQQLLLLVLATVIVGLATVAGIQAFNENQAQASQDALVQKGTSIASDIKGLHGKPSQLGGVDISNNPDAADVANALGYSGTNIDAQGAGANGHCDLAISGEQAVLTCDSDDAPQTVKVGFNPAETQEIQTSFDGSDPFTT